MKLPSKPEPEDKIARAKISLQGRQPFFAYLLSHMKIKFGDSEKIKALGVSPSGNIFFNRKYLSKLDVSQVTTLLCHVCLHIALNHLSRLGSRERKIWNIATDIVVNNILVSNDFVFPDGYKVPSDDSFEYNGKKITGISNRTAEEVYEILMEDERKNNSQNEQNSDYHRDTHSFENEEKKTAPNSNWKEKLIEAWTHSSMLGNKPKGMKRIIGATLHSKISWKTLVNEYVQKELVSDWSWERPSKKSLAVGVYLPYAKKESLDIVVTIDTSGSIDKEMLTEFVSEVIALSQSYDNLKITVLIGDSAIHEVINIDDKSADKLKHADFKGGGGTSHIPFYDWINKNKSDCKLVINLTDGRTHFPKNPHYPTLWLLTKGDIDVPFGRKIIVRRNIDGRN